MLRCSLSPFPLLTFVLLAVACAPTPEAEQTAAAPERPTWNHLSSANGDIPSPGPSDQQTGSHVTDLNGDGVNDFVVVARVEGPAVTGFLRNEAGWEKIIIDPEFLRVEAGGASADIDGDGDHDLVFGADAGGNQIWWWENPSPDFGQPWKRRLIKDSGPNKHHDQLFGDFDGDGAEELVSWNQRAQTLFLFEIPENPREAGTWEATKVYEWSEGDEHEGLAAADVDQDGTLDLIGGGRWWSFADGAFEVHVIDDEFRFTRAAAGDLVEGGWLEVVFAPGDMDGRPKWFEWNGEAWVGHDLVSEDVIHGHSLDVADVDGDGAADIFSAEMGQWGGKPTVNPAPKLRIFWGDGQGGFEEDVVIEGFGHHESRVADLDGDGDLDILGKPYNWEAPRVDVWLQE